jgi:hypothetical protein
MMHVSQVEGGEAVRAIQFPGAVTELGAGLAQVKVKDLV